VIEDHPPETRCSNGSIKESLEDESMILINLIADVRPRERSAVSSAVRQIQKVLCAWMAEG